MKKPTALEVEFSKLLSEAIDYLFDMGSHEKSESLAQRMNQAITNYKQKQTKK
jgi:hypothetical protein